MTATPPQPSWFEHLDVMQIFIALGFSYVIWSFKRGLSSFEDSVSEHTRAIVDLYEKHNELSQEFRELRGEHNACRPGGRSSCKQ